MMSNSGSKAFPFVRGTFVFCDEGLTIDYETHRFDASLILHTPWSLELLTRGLEPQRVHEFLSNTVGMTVTYMGYNMEDNND